MNVACLTIGSKVIYDGEVCTVIALAGDRATVQHASGGALSVGIAPLLAAGNMPAVQRAAWRDRSPLAGCAASGAR